MNPPSRRASDVRLSTQGYVGPSNAQALARPRCNILIALDLATRAHTSVAKIGEAFPWRLSRATGPSALETLFDVGWDGPDNDLPNWPLDTRILREDSR